MSTLAATAVTPGNVMIPAAMVAGKSSLSPFRYEERDGHVVVFAVPVMDEHVDDTRPKPFDNLTGQMFEAVYNATKGYEDNGAYAAIIVGHTLGDDSDTHREVVGHIRNFALKGKAPNRQIVGDFYFQKEFFDGGVLTNLYPRRSPEIGVVDFRIDPVALLGATSPARPLPDMLFKTGERREVYMTTNATRIQLSKEPHMDPEIKAMFEKLGERMSKFESGMEKFSASLEKFQAEGNDDEKDKEKKSRHQQDPADEDKDKDKKMGDHGDKKQGDDDEKDKEKKKRGGDTERFAQVTAKVSVLETSIDKLKEQNEQLQRDSVAAEVDGKIQYLKSKGVQLGNADEVTKLSDSLCKLDTEDREARYGEMERYWKRVPVDQRIDRKGGLVTGYGRTPEPDQTSFEEDATASAMKYQKEHPGVSLNQAYAATQGVEIGVASNEKC